MTYQETCDWLFSQLPMYQRMGKAAYKADLSNTELLMDHLEHPEKGFKSVHIAGTNGKGSTSHMIAAALSKAGYKVGLYTSPHLLDFRERIKINGAYISEKEVIDFVSLNHSFFEDNSLSFFEMTVGMAFDHFRRHQVDIAIIEVGLGGRLDSTNVITPLVGAITNIGLDHVQFLGNTLEGIAQEKAGIIKTDCPVVIGEYQEETYPVFKRIAGGKKAKLVNAFSQSWPDYNLDLEGTYQKHNALTALTVLNCLKHGMTSDASSFELLNDEVYTYSFAHVMELTGLQGRWQKLSETPLTIADTAHNKEGLSYTMSQLKALGKEMHIVLGMVSDKNLASLVSLFPRNANYYFCAANINRAISAEELKDLFEVHKRHGELFPSVSEAFNNAKSNASSNDVIYVGGSTFVVAEIL